MMMKPSEAIANIEYARKWLGSESDFSDEALDMAIAALKKQEVDKCCETCKYEHLDLDEYPCCDCIRAKDHYISYTEEES